MEEKSCKVHCNFVLVVGVGENDTLLFSVAVEELFKQFNKIIFLDISVLKGLLVCTPALLFRKVFSSYIKCVGCILPF